MSADDPIAEVYDALAALPEKRTVTCVCGRIHELDVRIVHLVCACGAQSKLRGRCAVGLELEDIIDLVIKKWGK